MAFPFQPFSPKQRRVLAVPTARKIVLLDGPVRSGKTIASILRWLAYLGELPKGSKVLMTGKTLGALRNNVLDDLFRMVGPKNYAYNRQDGILTVCGRRIRCVGAHDEGSQDIIQGDTYAGWYADEVAKYPTSFVNQGRARCSMAPGMIFWTCNPEGPYHPIHVDFIAEDAPAVQRGIVTRISFELDDNPALDEDYKDQLRTSFTGVFYKRNVLGLWVAAEGAIYDDLDVAGKHGFDDDRRPERFDRIRLSADYATQNPFHALLVGDAGGVSWVFAEWRWSGREEMRQKTDAQYSADLRAWIAREGVTPDRVIIDPSATSMIAQLRKPGEGWRHVTLAKNDVLDGIACVAGRLADGKLLIHRERCKHLAREMSGYCWDARAAKRGEDLPLKVHDHGPDALRYDQFTIFGGRQLPDRIDMPDLGQESRWQS